MAIWAIGKKAVSTTWVSYSIILRLLHSVCLFCNSFFLKKNSTGWRSQSQDFTETYSFRRPTVMFKSVCWILLVCNVQFTLGVFLANIWDNFNDNVSGANQSLCANYGNFNLGHQINIQAKYVNHCLEKFQIRFVDKIVLIFLFFPKNMCISKIFSVKRSNRRDQC